MASAQHRTRTADEMRGALTALLHGETEPKIAPNYDDPAIILDDAIDELLQLRQLRADVLTFIQDQQTKLTRR